MSNMINIQNLHTENIRAIVDWCRDKDEGFLRQWAGMGYTYPLTEAQIAGRLAEGAEIFEALVDGEIVGTIELISRNEQDNSVLVGRFVVNPALAGKGLGTAIMTGFLRYCKETIVAAEATLFVFDFNEAARRCYEKCGFEETERVQRPNGWIAIAMRKAL